MGALNSVFSAATVTMGAYQSYEDARRKKYEAELAADGLEAQASRKELEADEVLKIGELNQMEKVLKGRGDIAGRKVAYAASGVRVDSGSPLDVVADKAAWNEYERQKLEYESSLESWGLRYDATLLRQEAANTRASGSTSGSGVAAAIGGATQWAGLFK